MDALLSISALDTVSRTVTATTYAAKPLGVDMTSDLERQINDAVEAYRISTHDI